MIRRYGIQRPFANILRAEQTHAAMVASLLRAAGRTVPENPYLAGKPVPGFPASASAACQAGVTAEIANIRLYDRELLPVMRGHDQATAVLTKLRNDSEQRHLPAFQRCAQGGGTGGQGMGRGGGQGRGRM